MDNIVRLTANQLASLRLATGRAQTTGRTLRIATGRDNRGTWVKWDIGNSGWTPPLYGEREF